MWTIDGGEGEGGGQILRTALALSLVTCTPVRLTNIRKRRSKPGLLRQHLTAVRAAAEIGAAQVTGAELLSTELTFRPTGLVPGVHTFAIGSAGSTTLVLQTVLPALLLAKDRSQLVLEGGTHNPMAPPFEHLERAFVPLVERMMVEAAAAEERPRVRVVLERAGFFPAGGGKLSVEVVPARALAPLVLLERGEVTRVTGIATVANLPASIGVREAAAAREILGGDERSFHPKMLPNAPGPGNVMTVTVESAHVTEVFTSFGERGVAAEIVGASAAKEAKAYLDAGVPVAEHLADQLLLPMALAGKGTFRTLAPSSHTTTHATLLRQLLGTKVRIEQESPLIHRIEVER